MHRRETLLTIGVAALAAAAAPRFGGAQTLEKIRNAGPLTEDITNLYWANKTGLSARNGIDLELVGVNSGTAAMTAVVSGSYEISRTSLPGLFAAHLRDIPVVIVCPGLLSRASNPFSSLQVAPDAPYHTGADLNNKTIGVPALNDLNSLATKAWVDKNGGNWRSLKFTEIPNSAMEAAIVQKRVDAGILQSPQFSESVAAGRTRTLGDGWGAIAPAFMAGAFLARTDWANAHADACHRYYRIYQESAQYVNTHYAETAPLVAEFTKIEIASVTKMARGFNATSMDLGQIQPFIDASAKYEHIPRSFPARELVWEGFR
jgi:ABC-type nitrate/sulfonate/bicarbonate transport system substrate-binding protein